MKDDASTLERDQERQLIARVRAGDKGAARELIEAHKDRLFAFIVRMARHHHDAEEICQDAFLKAFASIDSFSTDYRFSTWLFTIGYRVCLNHLRRKRAVTGDLDFTALPAEHSELSSNTLESEDAVRLRTAIWSAVDRLSAPQRATLLLFYRNEFGCHEIARVLEVPVATVKSHLHRGRKRLRELLDWVSDGDLQVFRIRVG